MSIWSRLKGWLHDRLCPCTLSGMTGPTPTVYGLIGDDGTTAPIIDERHWDPKYGTYHYIRRYDRF